MQRNLTRRLFLGLSAACALASGLAVNSTAAQAQEQIEEITWALPAINDTMFVPRAWSTYVGAIMSLVQEGPLAFGDDLALIPGVANLASRPIRRPTSTRSATASPSATAARSRPTTSSRPSSIHMNPDSGSQLAAFFSSVASVEATGPMRGDRQAEGAERPVPVHAGPYGRLHLQEEPARGVSRGYRHARRAAARHRPLSARRVLAGRPRRARGARRLLGAEAGRQADHLHRDPGPADAAARHAERRHRRHLRPRHLRHRPMEGARQRRRDHRAVARHVHADARPFGAALRRHPCAQGDRLCRRPRGPGAGASQGQRRGGDGAQPAGDVVGRASARRGQGLLRDAAGLRVRPREGEGRAGAVGPCRRLRHHRARLRPPTPTWSTSCRAWRRT